jgi:hypothetical protein
MRSLFSPVLVAVAIAALILSAPVRAQAASFNFESVPLGTTTPFSVTNGGVTASFSSPDGAVFFVGNSFFSTLTGHVLLDADAPLHTLIVTFDQPINAGSVRFAVNGDVASTLTMQLFLGAAPVLSLTASGIIPPAFSFPEGSLAYSGPLGDNLRFTSTAVNFAIDDLEVTAAAAVPEPSTLGLLGSGLIWGARRWSRRRNRGR